MSFKTGRFSKSEDDFLVHNHSSMTDKQLAQALGRTVKSVTNRRDKLDLKTSRSKPKLTEKHREAYVATLDKTERKKFFEKEVKSSEQYRSIFDALADHEHKYYVEKYVDFMSDPTIETMTAMEKDALHQLILSELRIVRHFREEKAYNDKIEDWNPANGKPPTPISRAKEIRECQEVVIKMQASLMVERKQRLKDQSDQSMTFTNLIKEMKNPQNRARLGAEATMLKVIAEKTYNDKIDTGNIVSGKNEKFDISKNFRKDQMPELPKSFLPKVKKDE
jgi:hypothetical protein